MSRRFKPMPLLGDDQALAADPSAHASLSASAGTGKTQVLTARVLRLLLQGARPESILCLTFTKAAAAEMANRIGQRLADWVRLPDPVLRKDLFALGEAGDPPQLLSARRLFTRVLEAPAGLRIQTIHAFAQSLLAAFPAEAGIVPGFKPIEGRAEQELVRRTLADLLARAEAEGDAQLLADAQLLSRRLGESGAVEYLQACARRADALGALRPAESIELRLREMLGLPDRAVEEYVADQCGDDRFDCDLLHAIAAANRTWGTATGTKMVATIERWLAMAPANRAAALPEFSAIVFTGTGDLRKATSGQAKADPDYEAHAQQLAEAIGALLSIQSRAALAADMAAGLRAGQAFAAAYASAKRSAGVVDFDDLIGWTRRLLAQPGMGDWVRYKLDRQVDHILVDEAQDTNAAQFQIIRPLAEEFFSGSSESERRWRTLFAVGDQKQSIYGFQGSDPDQFRQFVDHFHGRAGALREAQEEGSSDPIAREFRKLSISASFRSAQAVLDLVDTAIAGIGFGEMGLPETPEIHRAFHSDRAGQVELWQPFAADAEAHDDEGEERWVALSARLYADHLAERIETMIARGPVLASTGRKVTPGDVLVLVRSRGQLAALIVARLFARGVPVAGVDRLHLHKPLAVQDLLAAVRFAVQPDDDLSLGNLLVSPLLGFDQEQLFALAHERKGSLWQALRARSGEGEPFASAHRALVELLRIADFTSPARFLETILSGPLQGRRRIFARLGMASRDAIDELMNSAIEFERGDTPSLDRFLSWFSRGDVDVQRDPGGPANEVRVMTVHGAKGLEAPVVILADSTADPDRAGRSKLTLDFPVGPGGNAPLLRPRKAERCSPFTELIEREEERDLQEHWRLLYVALTRAADRLIVAGIAPKSELAANSWHGKVAAALAVLGAEAQDDGSLLYRGSGGTVRARAERPRIEIARPAMPAWVSEAAPVEARPPRPLAPSALVEDREAAPLPTVAMRAAAVRGTLIHALLERLPPVEPMHRRAAALAWLDRSAGVAEASSREEIADLVCGLIDDPRFAPVFAEGSLGEAPIAATLADGRVIAGTVDRLLVEGDRIRVVDYKTGRAPADAASIPAAHRAQMQAYAQALAVIFPGRTIETALLYTASATLIELAA